MTDTPAPFLDFYAQAPRLRLHDPLAQLLGAAEGGVLEYQYLDAVRLAGHSCPTVAGTWLMLVHGLRALYGKELPVRGQIEVQLRGGADQGVTGVVASVVQLVTGAAPETGFQGLGSARLFARQHLLRFGQDITGELRLCRQDNGAAVQLRFDPSSVPWPAGLQARLAQVLSGQASAAERAELGPLWQARVRALLTTHAEDGRIVQLVAPTPTPGPDS